MRKLREAKVSRPLQVFIGFDPRSSVAYHVLAHSIMRRASRPVSITPLYRPQLRSMGAYLRERTPMESTDFSMTRFLTPYLAGFEGVSIFMDNDMLCLGDICELEEMALANWSADVLVVKHEYTPKADYKFLGERQYPYPRKNWSSVMVFNGYRSAVRSLKPEYVDNALPSDLHQFKWASMVGSLPPEWNHLVGEYDPKPDAKLVHFTLGGPWFSGYENCEYADHWFAEAANALTTDDRPFILPEYHKGMKHGNVQGFAGQDQHGLPESLRPAGGDETGNP